MSKREREFSTLAILGVYTGIVLEEKGFSNIHGVLDHMYPGIMTIGCSQVADTASREVLRQHPEFAELPECTEENFKQFAADALIKFGPKLWLSGPHGDGSPNMIGK